MLAVLQVWAVDLQRNELVVKDIILVAQGEMALEEFLKQVCVGGGGGVGVCRCVCGWVGVSVCACVCV